MAKDPERVKKRAAEAAKLGISEDELRQQRAAEDAANLERKAQEAGVSVERYLDERRRSRNRARRARKPG
jgi:putative heme degradation protein